MELALVSVKKWIHQHGWAVERSVPRTGKQNLFSLKKQPFEYILHTRHPTEPQGAALHDYVWWMFHLISHFLNCFCVPEASIREAKANPLPLSPSLIRRLHKCTFMIRTDKWQMMLLSNYKRASNPLLKVSLWRLRHSSKERNSLPETLPLLSWQIDRPSRLSIW